MGVLDTSTAFVFVLDQTRLDKNLCQDNVPFFLFQIVMLLIKIAKKVEKKLTGGHKISVVFET